MKDRLLTIVISAATTLTVMQLQPGLPRQLTVERLVVTKELIVSDTGTPWERGFEMQQIPRGIYARPVGDGPGGLWVRSRLIKGEIADPFDDRCHAFQTFRPRHDEPLTDALVGQGMMSLGGGGYGGDGLPPPGEILDLRGGGMRQAAIATPSAPTIVSDDGSRNHQYALIAVGPQGCRTTASRATSAGGRAKLRWERISGADAYVVLRDGQEITGPLRLEGVHKEWTDTVSR